MGFADRIGKGKPPKAMQIDSMDNDLKVGLWNTYLQFVIRQISRYRGSGPSDLDKYFSCLWYDFFKLPVDSISPDDEHTMAFIKDKFNKFRWIDVYEFLEFAVSDYLLIRVPYSYHEFVDEVNRVLEKEFSGFRMIDKKFVPITNKVEIDEITDALMVGQDFFTSGYKNVNLHIKEALDKLSDKKNPDYRNSIKEAISAVEALCRQLTEKSTLGDSLKEFERKGIIVNPLLKSGIEKLYAYTNDKESGIRHALIDTPNLPTFNEAKFMLVTCSAFINYVISQIK